MLTDQDDEGLENIASSGGTRFDFDFNALSKLKRQERIKVGILSLIIAILLLIVIIMIVLYIKHSHIVLSTCKDTKNDYFKRGKSFFSFFLSLFTMAS